MKLKRPILRYHGGKWVLAPWIISHFPQHRIYVELFGGGGSILMRKHPVYSEVYNDLWGIVVNVFRVLRDPEKAERLRHLIELTPFSRDEFDQCRDIQIEQIEDDVERARRTILRSFAGFGSASTNAKYATGFRGASNQSGTTPAHDWANYPANIPAFTNRLRGVVIENRDYRKLIPQHDTAETLFYADPPYVHSERNMKRGNAAYAEEMTDDDHVEMLAILKGVEGYVVLSGYDNDLYNDMLPDWHKVTRGALADGAKKRTEVLWINRDGAGSQTMINF